MERYIRFFSGRKEKLIFLYFKIYNSGYGVCVDSLGHKINEKVGVYGCHSEGGNQVFEFTTNFHISKPEHKLCLGFIENETQAIFQTCEDSSLAQTWDYDTEFQLLRNRETLFCLSVIVDEKLQEFNLVQSNCVNEDVSQKWYFRNSLFH